MEVGNFTSQAFAVVSQLSAQMLSRRCLADVVSQMLSRRCCLTVVSQMSRSCLAFYICLRSCCADSSSQQISAILVGRLTMGKQQSPQISAKFPQSHTDECKTPGSPNSLLGEHDLGQDKPRILLYYYYCYAMLYYYYTMLYYAILYYTILYESGGSAPRLGRRESDVR